MSWSYAATNLRGFDPALTIDQPIRLRAVGVTPAYVAAMNRSAG